MKNLIKKLAVITLALALVLTGLPVGGVNVVQAATISLNKTKVTITEGDTYKLKVSGSCKKVTWASSNNEIATVSTAGKVTALKAGKVTIKAKVSNKTYKCTVTVKKSDAVSPEEVLTINTEISLDNTTITKSGSCGDNATWSLYNRVLTEMTSENILVISGTGKTYDYSYKNTDRPWSTQLSAIIIGEGITSIGDYMFADESYKQLKLPNTLVTIGNGAFRQNPYLTELNIPDSVTTINDTAFTGNYAIKN